MAYAPEMEARFNDVGYWKERAFQAEQAMQEKYNHWLYTFAGQAMQGMISSMQDGEIFDSSDSCKAAVMVAKDLLAELEKGEG